MQKEWYHRIRSCVIFIVCIMFLTACATISTMDFLKRSKQAASASNTVYNSLAPQVTDEIAVIVEKHRAGTITDEDRERLKTLNEVNKILEMYATTHNLFVQSLKTWEATKSEPQDTAMLENQLLRLINMAIDLGKELNLNIPGGLR
ncbi:MAG: hypothetical protein ACMUIL_03280 [bacterium]